MLEVHIVRVFTDARSRFGKHLGVVLDTASLGNDMGIRLTRHLGFSETVFVDDVDRSTIRIFTSTREMTVARYPVVGVAWLLGERTGTVSRVLRPRLAAAMPAWREGASTWIKCTTRDARSWEVVELASVADVEALAAPPGPQFGYHQFWAWIDETAGVLRARNFAASIGVAEDEATGSAAVHLAQRLGRRLEIRQGRGSVIEVRPAVEAACSEIGGRVASEGHRKVPL